MTQQLAPNEWRKEYREHVATVKLLRGAFILEVFKGDTWKASRRVGCGDATYPPDGWIDEVIDDLVAGEIAAAELAVARAAAKSSGS